MEPRHGKTNLDVHLETTVRGEEEEGGWGEGVVGGEFELSVVEAGGIGAGRRALQSKMPREEGVGMRLDGERQWFLGTVNFP